MAWDPTAAVHPERGVDPRRHIPGCIAGKPLIDCGTVVEGVCQISVGNQPLSRSETISIDFVLLKPSAADTNGVLNTKDEFSNRKALPHCVVALALGLCRASRPEWRQAHSSILWRLFRGYPFVRFCLPEDSLLASYSLPRKISIDGDSGCQPSSVELLFTPRRLQGGYGALLRTWSRLWPYIVACASVRVSLSGSTIQQGFDRAESLTRRTQ